MFRLASLLGVIGLAAVIGLIVAQGYDQVLGAFARGGWGLVWASLFHFVPMVMASVGWRVLFPGHNRPSLGFVTFVMWLRASVNNLMPVARIGGEIVAARVMIKHGIYKGTAIASVVVETTISVITVFLFDILGILLIANRDPDTDLLTRLGVGMLVSLPILVAMMFVQKVGFFGLLARLAHLMTGGRWKAFFDDTARLDRAVGLMYRRVNRILICGAWMLASWVVGTGGIWISLLFLGHELPLLDCLILEAMIQLVSSAAFVVPGALGAQEGAFLFFGQMLGLPPETALALALMRRCRDILLYVPGLVVWQVKEGRWALRKRQAAVLEAE